ncbi:spondin domain-containing protein [Crocosphaera sp. XPORK-15E]|nr:spondin domain-containing protein [Crocosphaera sp. XPORK-15E]
MDTSIIIMLKNKKILSSILAFGSVLATASTATALTLKVEVENLAPTGGIQLTPVWVGFHDGSFDSYDGGRPAQPGIKSIAEDGDATLLSADFLNNLTYIDTSGGTRVSATVPSTQVGTRKDGLVGSGPIAPGATVSESFYDIATDSSNQYFSYASMLLPSSDYLVFNGGPTTHNLLSLLNGTETTISFFIGETNTVNDAGTEVNDFSTSAGNALFPGLPPGQTGPNQGADQNGVVTNVADPIIPFADFLNRPDDFDFANLNFNNTALYPNGVARVTISVVPDQPPEEAVSVPEPGATAGLFAFGGLLLVRQRLRKNNSTKA